MTVTHAAAEEHHRPVEQALAIRIADGFQLVEEAGQLLHLEGFDDRQAALQDLRFAVMRETMVASAQAEIAGVDDAGNPERRHARRVRLQGEREQIVESRNGVREGAVLRRCHFHFGLGLVQPVPGHAELPLHFAHRGEILVELLAVGLAEPALEQLRVTVHRIEDACIHSLADGNDTSCKKVITEIFIGDSTFFFSLGDVEIHDC